MYPQTENKGFNQQSSRLSWLVCSEASNVAAQHVRDTEQLCKTTMFHVILIIKSVIKYIMGYME